MCPSLQLILPHLPNSPRFAKLKDILENVVKITMSYEMYEIFEPNAPALRNILMARHCVLHDLLTIGDATTPRAKADRHDLPSGEETHYELTWLCTHAYMVLDLFPCTRGPGPHELLSERLHTIIPRAQQQGIDVRQSLLYHWSTELLHRLDTPST
jgi:hypothetical protein